MPKPPDNLEEILAAVAGGNLSPTEAAERLREGEVRYLDEFAVLDLGRAARKGVPEIVYAPGKTPAQVAKICASILDHSERVVVSGPTPEQERLLHETLPGVPVRNAGKALVAGPGEPAPTGGRVVAISAGTSDLPVLEEAVLVVREMGVAVKSFHDVGVAGIHRLAEPFVGLPTSTGYGLGGDGTAAILSMLQSCSPGLSVVNVDNGTGAGVAAALVANRAATYRENLRASD